MSLRIWLQNYLGIYDIHDSIENMRNHFLAETKRRDEQIRPLLAAFGRIIAKQDPYFGRHETDDIERRRESDALGEQVIEKLKAEDKAQRHTLGEL